MVPGLSLHMLLFCLRSWTWGLALASPCPCCLPSCASSSRLCRPCSGPGACPLCADTPGEKSLPGCVVRSPEDYQV